MGAMAVLISAILLIAGSMFFAAQSKGRLVLPKRFKSAEMVIGITCLVCASICFTAFQSLLHREVGGSAFDYRQGRLVFSGRSRFPARYTQTKWFGLAKEGEWLAMPVREDEEYDFETEWKYRDSKGKWQEVPPWISSPKNYDNREFELDNRGYHEQ
jgi:hypothetical protein